MIEFIEMFLLKLLYLITSINRKEVRAREEDDTTTNERVHYKNNKTYNTFLHQLIYKYIFVWWVPKKSIVKFEASNKISIHACENVIITYIFNSFIKLMFIKKKCICTTLLSSHIENSRARLWYLHIIGAFAGTYTYMYIKYVRIYIFFQLFMSHNCIQNAFLVDF